MEYYSIGIERGILSKFNIALMAQQDRIFFDLVTDAAFLAKHDLSIQLAFEEYFNAKFNGILNR
jgi:hypothetical protein